ncbi:Cytochrome P450 monooxygenase apf7 [Fusarium oxysporum f. sp. albedinis]|nr:Cytochrome P450 monooxygenase apf7 [Fusarium oxysporum f. sp. albedinis]
MYLGLCRRYTLCGRMLILGGLVFQLPGFGYVANYRVTLHKRYMSLKIYQETDKNYVESVQVAKRFLARYESPRIRLSVTPITSYMSQWRSIAQLQCAIFFSFSPDDG